MNELTGCLKIKHFNMNVIVLVYFITPVKYAKFAQVSYFVHFMCLYPFRVTNITRTVVEVDLYLCTGLFSTDTIKLSHQYIYILSEVALDEINISGCLRMHF